MPFDPASPYGINTHLPSATQLDQVAAAGIAWIRVDFNWDMIEPTRGGYDWTLTDAVVNEARARGLEVYPTLAYTPGWANGGQGRGVTATDPQDWYRFVHEAVRRYRDRVNHWGMWNEPNSTLAGTRRQYINEVLQVGARAVREADAASRVLGPELAMVAQWYIWLYQVLDQAGDALDVVTQHAYDDSGMAVLCNLLQVRGIMQGTGAGAKELWLTETGWRTDKVSEETQAAYYEQVLEGVDTYDWLDKVFFYELVDDPTIAAKYGILHSDLTPKPAYHTYQRHIAAPGAGARQPGAGPLARLDDQDA